ncbi:MAG: histidine kinase [Sneathiella sp.]
MTHYLVTEENPNGSALEDVLAMVRADIVQRCTFIVNDRRPEAQAVLANNMRILGLLTDAVELADSSTRILDKAFGPSQAGKGGPPRIGDKA